MVTINCSYTVTPSESTPNTTLPLSHCDQTKLPNHASQLFVYNSFKGSSSSSVEETLRTSLSKALVHYYPLAGRLCWIQQGNRMELLCNSKGVPLFEATCHLEVSSGFDHLVDQLVPKVDYGVTPIEDMPLVLAQLTRFSCGGITLGLTLCRAVVDGSSVGSFISTWAKFGRGEGLLDCEMLPMLDRTVLDSLGLNVAPRFEHDEFLPPPIWEGSGLGKTQLRRNLDTAILKLNKGQVEKLKGKSCGFGNGSPKRPYTSFEVICGHLWRCVCKVRYEGNGAQKTRLTTLVNCRNKFRPPLPHAYFGNATFPTVTLTCSFDDVVGKPLGYAVGNVREAIARMSDEYARSAIDYIANQKDMSLLRDNLYKSGGGEFGENPNLYVVAWTNFPFYDTDFGWGKPACLVPTSINSDGKAFVMNDRSGDGFIVAVCLQQSRVDALKKLFYDEMEEVGLPSSKL